MTDTTSSYSVLGDRSGAVEAGEPSQTTEQRIPRPLYDVRRWGPSMWHAFHITALIKDMKMDNQNVQKESEHWILALPSVLPCPTCSVHLAELYRKMPLPRPEKDAFKVFQWSVDIHNAVNKRLNKPNVSFEEAAKLYFEKGSNPCTNKNMFMNPKKAEGSPLATSVGPAHGGVSIMDKIQSIYTRVTRNELARACILGILVGGASYALLTTVRKTKK